MILVLGNDPTEIAAAKAKANAEAVKRFGMLYQWGRKDPFTPARNLSYNNTTEVQIYKADGTAITKGTSGIGTTDEQEFKYEARTTTTQTTINHLIQNPSIHYTKEDGTNDVPIASTEYYKDTKEGDWWNPTIKTIYDPCPNGYRIPKLGTYNNLTLDTFPWTGSGLTAGRTFKNLSFFPASGNRSSRSGRFGGVGTDGDSWTSTVYLSGLGFHLRFNSDKVYPAHGWHNSFGMPTRCIKE